VSYEVAQATFNNQGSAKGAGAEKSQPRTGAKADAAKEAAAKTGAAATSESPASGGRDAFGSKAAADDAAGSQPAGKSATSAPRILPDATGAAPSAIRGARSATPPAALDADDAERRTAPSSVVAPGRVGGTTTESEATSDADRASRAAASASMALLENSLTPGNDSVLAGRTLTLAEALGRGSNHTQRFEIAELYWRLALAVANYNWAVDESKQLEALPAGQGAVDAPLLTTARAAAQARMLEAQALAVAAQQELADAIGQPTQNLPLTVEQPLVGPYRTLFDRLFATRSPPPRTRGIDRTLPLKRQAIDVRTAAVQAAASAVRAAEDAHAQGNADVLAVLAAHQDLARQRREFLRAVGEYNADIVAYAAAVANPGTSNTVLVGMLTRSKAGRLSDTDSQGSTFVGGNQPTLADPVLDPDYPVRPAATTDGARDDQNRWLGVESPRALDGVKADSGDLDSASDQLQPIESETSAKE
jgi:hypothetical protein